MLKEQPYLPQPGKDERAIVEEMCDDAKSVHWEKCNAFVRHQVYIKARNIPLDYREEVIQEAMYKIVRYLPSFRFGCAFRTWLYLIIHSCTSDVYRKMQSEESFHLPLTGLPNEDDSEHGETSWAQETESAERVYERNAEILDGKSALFEYAKLHSHPVRDQQIIRMVIIEGYPQVQVAGMVGCEAAVVSHVVREAQRYARGKLRCKL